MTILNETGAGPAFFVIPGAAFAVSFFKVTTSGYKCAFLLRNDSSGFSGRFIFYFGLTKLFTGQFYRVPNHIQPAVPDFGRDSCRLPWENFPLFRNLRAQPDRKSTRLNS